MLDVATSHDDNDWPWGNDLLRQAERKKGARRDRVLCKYQAMATQKRRLQVSYVNIT